MGDCVLPPKINKDLENLIQDLDLSEYSIHLSEGSQKGDNYVGIITKVEIKAQKDGRTAILNLVVKYASQSKEYREYMKIEMMYDREVYAYQNIMPELLKFQIGLNIEPYYPFAKVLKASLDPPYEYLIMEDMNVNGYIMRDRKAQMDFTHCSFVMKSLGKLHALSFALKQKRPEIFQKLAYDSREIYFNSVSLDDLSNNVGACCKRIINNLDEHDDEDLIHKIVTFLNFPSKGLVDDLSAEAAGEYAVLCHGDSWSNNILFKYEDEDPSNPTDLCFLDWQMSRSASPAVDVSYFLFVCTERELRQLHYNNLLDIYHSSLTDALKHLGCKEDLFPKEVFLDHMRRFSKYGLMIACLVVPLITADNEELPVWTAELTKDERRKMFTEARNNEKVAMIRLVDVFKDFDRYGYFN